MTAVLDVRERAGGAVTSPQRLLIDGEWVEAASGKTFATLDPSTGEELAQAKRLPLGVPDVHGLPPAQAHAIARAAEQASLHSFRLSLAIAAALVAAGGLAGALGVRNPSREVPCEDCPGGQLVGASSHLGRVLRPRAGPAAEPAQPTGSRA